MPHNSQKQRRKRSSKSRTWNVKEQEESGGGCRKTKSKGRNSGVSSKFVQEQDVTLKAYADNANRQALTGRFSKAAAMSINKDVKQVNSASGILSATTNDDVIDDWYEREFSDEEDVFIDEISNSAEEQEKNEVELKSKTKTGSSGSISCDTFTGHVYPTVIWYLVSAFIYPEDVCTFACLCHDTYALTNTAGFWRRLYFRYCNPKSAKNLPKDLHHTSIQRTFGLRSLVIRSLQFIYPPFVVRNSVKKVTFNEAVEKMSGVVFMYHLSRRKGSNFVYYLKFQQIDEMNHSLKEALNRNQDIYYNSNRGQCILKVICKQTNHLEPERIMGKELVCASISVSSGMSYNKLKLEFQEPAIRQQNKKNRRRQSNHMRTDRTILILDPVLCASVYHWWHPLFHEEFRVDSESIGPVNGNLNMWNANS